MSLLKLINTAKDEYVKVLDKTPKKTDVSASIKWPALAACIAENVNADKEAIVNITVTPIVLRFKYFEQMSTMAPGIAAIGIEK